MPARTRLTIPNGDGKACVVCGVQRAFYWMYVVGEDGARVWCCKGDRNPAHKTWRTEHILCVNWDKKEQRRDAERARVQTISVVSPPASPPLSVRRERRLSRAEASEAPADAAVRSRTPRVSSRVRSVSPRDSSRRAKPARARRFIVDEAAASDADDDDKEGAENLSGYDGRR